MGEREIRIESFVVEKEPWKNDTIIPPIAERQGGLYTGEVKRVPLKESKWPNPVRKEKVDLEEIDGYCLAAVGLFLVAGYLAAALSVAYAIPAWKLLGVMGVLVLTFNGASILRFFSRPIM